MLKRRLCFVTLLLGVLCSACSTTEEVVQNPANTESSHADTPSSSTDQTLKTYKAVLANNLKVDATVDVPDVKDIPTLQVAETVFDESLLVNVFLGQKDVKVQKHDGETDYTSSDKSLMVFNEQHSFKFFTPVGDYVNAIINNLQGGIEPAFKSEELDFMTKSKAVEQAADIVKKLNVTPHLPPKVYALDYKTLQMKQDALMQDENFKWFVERGKNKVKEKWTKDDECYYLIFKVDIHGVPGTPTGYRLQSSELQVPGSEARVIVSKNGIVSFDIVGSIYQEQNVKADPSSLISIEQALDNLKKKYDTVILKDELTVTNISMVYAPVIISSKVNPKTGELLNKQLEMVPAWYFNMDQKYTKGDQVNTASIVVHMNAITGKEIH